MVPSSRTTAEQVRMVLMKYVSSITAESVFKAALSRAGRSAADLDRSGLDEPMIAELGRGLAFFLTSEEERRDSIAKLWAVMQRPAASRVETCVDVVISDESGIVGARMQARSLACDLGFGKVDQAKIATCVSELARNIHSYAKAGRIELEALESPRRGLRVVSTDSGPGISNLAEILSGGYRSKTGMGLGLLGCKRLMDEFDVKSAAGVGTVVTVVKYVE
jgi:serine/threonine-protein kinase RsbT